MRTNWAQSGRAAEVLTGVILLLVLCAAPVGALQARKAKKSRPPATSAAGSQGGESNDLLAKPSSLPALEIADVDEVVPPIAADVSCPLQDVLHSASDRVKELLTNLPQYSATELVEHREAGRSGNWRAPETVTFQYVAELQEIRPGMLHMEETRNGSTSPLLFPAHLADYGLPAIALVFHPYYIGEYSMSCEGLGKWEGRPAWQIHFQQRPDQAARLRAYVVGNRLYPLKLKGRAWIDPGSYQVLHLETDLLEPVRQIHLVREHLAIDYGLVQFQKHDAELWLPHAADVYMNFRGRIYYRRHSFSDFLLFSVDVKQKIVEPVEH